MALVVYKIHGAPSPSTFGNVGDYYIDLNTDVMYKCVEVVTQGKDLGYVTIYQHEGDNTVYVWEIAGDDIRAQIDANSAAISELSEDIVKLKENGGSDERLDKIASFFDLTEPVRSNNRLNPAEVDAGHFLTNKGVYAENQAYSCTGFIPVSSGEILQMFANPGEVAYREIKIARWVSAYDSNKTLLPDLGAENAKSYTVPEGVSYVRYSYTSFNTTDSTPITRLEAIVATDGSNTIVPYEPYGIVGAEPHLKAEAYTHIKNGFRVAVNGSWTADKENHDISEYMMRYMTQLPNGFNGSISMGKGYRVSGGGYVTVDATNLSYFTSASETAALTYPHDLTIKDYLAITIELDKSAKAKITVKTNGGSYTNDEMSLAAVRRGAFFVTDSASEGVNGHFSYAAKGWGYNTHVYGDSYIGVYSDNRWPYYAVQDGYDVYFNGFSGRNSADALPVLKSELKQGARPERIIWALGMNDPDKNGEPNASWLACVEELKTICKDNAIELIFSTIPLVTAVDNTHKNAYVRESGYRYIDFATAVGAAEDTTWYDNMLADDGVHPDIEGAVALYQQVLTDVPEITMD